MRLNSLKDIASQRSRAVSRGVVSSVIAILVILAAAAYLYANPPPSISGTTQTSQSTQLYTFTNYGATTSLSTTSTSTAIPASAVYVYMPSDGGYPFSQYTPQVVTVVIGVNNTVVWVNQDSLVHNAIAFSGMFDSGDISPGASYSFTFAQAGVYSYYCSYHPSMAGTIIVKSPA
jgi:plastocyanin